jgi:hypothetical protein
MSAVPRRLSLGLLLVVFILCVVRAERQSFTVDEAWVFHSFVNRELSAMAHSYDACNHVLHTVLMKVARASLGTGELALRLPSLLGCLLYFAAVYRLTKLLLGGWTQLLAVALLILHPLVLDFMVAARGYGLALALFFWALYFAIRYLSWGFDIKHLRWAGLLAGLSIAANLTMLVPAAALGLMLLVLAGRDGLKGWGTVVDGYGGPAVVTAFLIVVIPLLPATGDNFYYGATTLRDSVDSLVTAIVKVQERWPGPQRGAWAPWISLALAPALLMALAWGAIRTCVLYLRAAKIRWRLAPFALSAGTLILSAVAVVAMHAAAGVKYPLGRTGLYFLPLFFLSLMLGTRLLEGRGWRWVRRPAALIALAVVVICLVQTDNRFFAEWRFDASTARLMRSLDNDYQTHSEHRRTPVRVGTHVLLQNAALYYRIRRRMNWSAEPSSEKLDSIPYDYYLLTGDGLPLIGKLHLRIIDSDRLSGSVLARRPGK